MPKEGQGERDGRTGGERKWRKESTRERQRRVYGRRINRRERRRIVHGLLGQIVWMLVVTRNVRPTTPRVRSFAFSVDGHYIGSY